MSTSAIIPVHSMMTYMRGIANELMSDVWLGPPFEPEAGQPYPDKFPDELVAVWDTGATGTTISHALARRFNLEEIGEIRISGVTGCAVCKSYLVSVHLPNGVIIPQLEVSDCEGEIGCDVLIGMDIIRQGDFAVSNYDGITTFTFRTPSVERIDFTTQLGSIQVDKIKIGKPKIGRNVPCPCGSGKKYKKCCGK